MRVIDRLTRDSSSGWAWAILTVVCLGLGLMAIQLERTAAGRELAAAQSRAVFYANTVLFASLPSTVDRASLPGGTYKDLITDAKGQILTDPLVARIRVWAPTGTLMFSTDDRDELGSEGGDAVRVAIRGTTVSRVSTVPLTRAGGKRSQITTLYETFTPQRVPDRVTPLGVTQIDQYHEPIVSTAAEPWRTVQFAMFGLGLCCVLMLFATLRRPKLRAFGLEGAEAMPGLDPDAARAEAERARVLEEQRAELDAKRAEVAAAVVELADAERGRQEAVEAADRVREELVLVAAERDGLTSQLSDARGALEAESVRSEEGRVRELEEESAALTAVVRDLRGELQTSQKEAVATGADAASARTELDNTRKELDTMRTEHDTTRSDLETARAELASVSSTEQAAAVSAEAESRAAEAESRAAEAESRLAQIGVDIARLEERASLAELRAADIDLELRTAKQELERSAVEIETLRRAPGLGEQAMQLLEQRLAAAEARAEEAELRLSGSTDDPAHEGNRSNGSNGNRSHIDALAPAASTPDGPPAIPLGDEASDLRSRLARTAARKKRTVD